MGQQMRAEEDEFSFEFQLINSYRRRIDTTIIHYRWVSRMEMKFFVVSFVQNNLFQIFSVHVQSLSFSQNIYKYFIHVRFFIYARRISYSSTSYTYRNTYMLTVILHSTSIDTHVVLIKFLSLFRSNKNELLGKNT